MLIGKITLRRLLCILTMGVALSVHVNAAFAGTFITDSTGGFTVSVAKLGNLEPGDTAYNVLRRNSDAFDPVVPGNPREAWGVSANGLSGYADSRFYGNKLLAPGTESFTANSALISTYLTNLFATANLLKIDQQFSFVAANVLGIKTTITNVSGVDQAVKFDREVDWDMPLSFANITKTDALSGPVSAATFYGFESPDPLSSYGFSAAAGGGTYGPGDFGAGFNLDLGTLGAGASTSFYVYHALNVLGQNEADLRAQVYGLGATFLISGTDPANPDGSRYSTVLGFGPVTTGSAVPEPASMITLAAGALGMLGFRMRKRKADNGLVT